MIWALVACLAVVTWAAPATARVKEIPMDSDLRLTEGLVLSTLDGEEFDLGSLRGERVLLVTWASW